MNCHEAIDVMGDAVGGRLEPALRAGFEEHVTECASCGTYLEQLRFTRKALQSLPRGGGTSPHRMELIRNYREEFGRESD